MAAAAPRSPHTGHEFVREFTIKEGGDPWRLYESRPGRYSSSKLYDVDGDERFTLPGVGHKDELLRCVVLLHERAIKVGEEIGRAQAQREIRAALGITCDPDKVEKRVTDLEER